MFSMLSNRTARKLALVLVVLGYATAAGADIVQVTYHISASGFQDSQSNPPNLATSTSVDGTYTFTFDTDVSATGIMPDSVIGLDITKANGAVIDFDENNSGVRATVFVGPEEVDVTIGGNVSTIDYVVGISDDFRVRFKISRVDFEVLSVLENFLFVTTVNPFYGAQNTTVTLVSQPAAVPLLGPWGVAGLIAGLASLGWMLASRAGTELAE